MQITPDVQKELGEAVILAKGRSAAITSGSWTIILPAATDYIPEDIVEHAAWLADQPGYARSYVDYRVLNAREFVNDRFLAANGKELESIASTGPFRYGNTVTYEMVEKIVVDNEYIFEGVDLVDLFNSGKAEPTYAKTEQAGSAARIVAGAHKADAYLFRVEGKVLAVAGPLLRGLQKAGFSIILNTEFEPKGAGEVPYLGVVNKEDHSICGALAPLAETGITHDSLGRSLHTDAGKVCWISHANAEMLIGEDHGFFDPSMVRHDWEDLSIDDRVKVRKYCPAALGIAALRWHGVPDSEIQKILNYAAYDAWCTLYHEALKSAADLLDQVGRFSETTEITTSSVHRVRQFAHNTQSLCSKVESLTKVMQEVGGDSGDGLGFGPLPELVQYVQELEEACGL